MAKMEPALTHIARWEGGFSDHKADRGGTTNWGVTQGALDRAIKKRPKAGYPASVADLTYDQAVDIFTKDYAPKDWDKIQDQRVATLLLDASINHGPERGVTLMQRSLCAAGVSVTVDGKFGPKTLDALNVADPDAVLAAFVQQRTTFYHYIVDQDPEQAIFLKGWLRRAKDIPVLA